MESDEGEQRTSKKRRQRRDKLFMPEDKLQELVDKNYSGADIAEYFGCNARSVYRRLQELKISPHGYKKPGVRIVRLNRRGVPLEPHAPYWKQNVMLKNDVLGDAESQREGEDDVPAPLSITHFGGFFKLASWGIVFHVGIDVFSRYIYAEASTDNSAATVLSAFQSGVAEKGLPVRVRCERADENAGVVHYMNVNRPDIKDNVVYRNINNASRLRRLLVDLWRNCLLPFRDEFRKLENAGKLDRENEVDLYCLHFVFLPLIRAKLAEFKKTWNSHRVRTAGYLSPKQLHLVGLHILACRSKKENKSFPELDQSRIIEIDPEDGDWPPIPDEIVQGGEVPVDREELDIPVVGRVLKRKKKAELLRQFPEDSITFDNAPKKYRKVRRFVRRILNPPPS